MSSYLKFCQSQNGSRYCSRNGSCYGFRFWNQDQETFLGTIELVSKIVNPEMVPDPDPDPDPFLLKSEISYTVYLKDKYFGQNHF